MRIRNNPRALEKNMAYPDIVLYKPQDQKGRWHEFFMQKNGSSLTAPIHIELGMGRGKFLTTHAVNHPHVNYIGMELRNEVVCDGLEKALALKLNNIVLLPINIMEIEEVFEKHEADTLYINFCDPWPKVRHAKRRLTHRLFLERYRNILKKGGTVQLKTDSRELFDFSVVEFQEAGFEITEITHDLSGLNDPDNVMTEYETKFVRMGIKINRLKAICK